MSWPTALPTPQLTGDTATFADVLPGVDLQVTAKSDGIGEVVVVKTLEAGKNPQLRALSLGMQASGLTAKQDATGRIGFVNNAKNELLSVPPPAMWDSSAGAADARAVPVPGPVDRLRGPVEGDLVRAVGMTLADSVLNLVPNATLLDAVTTRYPVYIDPTVGPGQSARLMVDGYYPDVSYYNWANDQGVGYQNYSGQSTKRLYWTFPSTFTSINGSTTWRGTKITSAKFLAYNTHSAYCTARAVTLYRTNSFTSSTNWNSKPANLTALDVQTFAGGDTCGGTTPHVAFTATAGLQAAADSSASSITLSLQASETDPLNWKRFRYDATLSVTFDVKPTISGNRLSTPSKTCVTGSTRPVISANSVVFQATSADSSDDMDAIRWFYKGSQSTTYSSYATASAQSPGTHVSPAVQVVNGTTYSFYAVAIDSYTTSAASATCEFTVDTSAPPSPSVSSIAYPSDGASHGGSGIAGTFAFSATGAVSFIYGFDVDTPTIPVTASGSAANATFAPPSFGPHYLKVSSKDLAGNVSPQTVYRFNVYGTVADSTHRYKLDSVDGASPYTSPDSGTVGSVAVSSTTTVPLTVGRLYDPNNSATLGDRAVDLTAGGSLSAVPTTALLSVSNNFTVCAYVQAMNGLADGTYVVAHQSTSATYAWQLEYAVSGGAGSYQISLHTTNSATGPVARVTSTLVSGVGWESVCAQYEADDSPTLSLAVAGMNVGKLAIAPAGRVNYSSAGEFRIGAASGGAQRFPGYVDDVRLFQGSFDDTTLNVLAG